MKITIKNLQGKPTEYEVSDTDTLEDLKKKIATDFNTEVGSIKLIHFGKVLGDNGKKVVDYGVKDKDFLVMMTTKVTINATNSLYRNQQLYHSKHQHQ